VNRNQRENMTCVPLKTWRSFSKEGNFVWKVL